ncbi:MAG TPA: DUF456 domain-containing protein, partial [Planctomycetaceae bacterium]|nr:DUF456 domain-containing protein [Planctomycetaceae bacterium]
FAWYPSQPHGPGLSWGTVVVAAVLAAAGEVFENVAGAAAAVRLGASRRSVILSLVGAFLGSLLGAGVASPVPILGWPVGAVLGGAVGAFLGATAGEVWKGRRRAEAVAVGKAAFTGRLLGTGGKLVAGAIMVLAIAVDAFVN